MGAAGATMDALSRRQTGIEAGQADRIPGSGVGARSAKAVRDRAYPDRQTESETESDRERQSETETRVYSVPSRVG